MNGGTKAYEGEIKLEDRVPVAKWWRWVVST